MPLFLLSPRLLASRMAYAALVLSLSLLATVAPAPVAAQGLPDFTELVEKVGPAVVNIRTTERGRTARGGSGNEQDDEMAELIGLREELTRAHQQGDDVAVAAQAVQHRGELLLARRKLGRVALPVEQRATRGGEALARI